MGLKLKRPTEYELACYDDEDIKHQKPEYIETWYTRQSDDLSAGYEFIQWIKFKQKGFIGLSIAAGLLIAFITVAIILGTDNVLAAILTVSFLKLLMIFAWFKKYRQHYGLKCGIAAGIPIRKISNKRYKFNPFKRYSTRFETLGLFMSKAYKDKEDQPDNEVFATCMAPQMTYLIFKDLGVTNWDQVDDDMDAKLFKSIYRHWNHDNTLT